MIVRFMTTEKSQQVEVLRFNGQVVLGSDGIVKVYIPKDVAQRLAQSVKSKDER